jgi:BMFP domain-containing protein YqiC
VPNPAPLKPLDSIRPAIAPLASHKPLGPKSTGPAADPHAQLLQRLDAIEARLDHLHGKVLAKIHADMLALFEFQRRQAQQMREEIAELHAEVAALPARLLKQSADAAKLPRTP